MLHANVFNMTVVPSGIILPSYWKVCTVSRGSANLEGVKYLQMVNKITVVTRI
jgi:hypothetical protein